MSSNSNNRPRKSQSRNTKNSFTTRSGSTIKVNRSLSDRFKASRDARVRRRANRLATLPKGRVKRILYRLEPRRLAQYWFSRDGAIMALKLLGIGIITGFILLIGMFAYFRKDLPKLNGISGGNLGGSVTYYDRTGQTVLWQDYNAVKRLPVSSDNISPYMKNATVAIEDKDYYKHGAFDVRGIARAGVHDLLSQGGVTQGGSTITQQVVKLNENWTTNRTISRKVKELILAVELEREYSKADILTGYLNTAPYGGIENGVEAASRDYFQIGAKNLTIEQAAFLAAMPQSPSYYSPYSQEFNKGALIGRQHYIIDQMQSQGYITKDQATAAKKVDILAEVKPLQPKYQGIKAPYFVLAAKQELLNKYRSGTVNYGGWKVITTLDMNLQNTAEQLVAKNLTTVKRLTAGGADEEATIAENVPTGQIEALVGGTDFTNPDFGQNNYAAGILIPPGSSFKPYDYATFINNNTNVGAGSVLYDAQGALPGYPCTNKALPKNGGNCLEDYDFLFPGPLTLRYALGGSRNVPAVKAMMSAVPNDTSSGHVASINKVISTASSLMDNPYNPGSTYNCYGDEALTQTTQCYGASAIGDGAFLHLDDHVNGLASLGRLGNAIPKTYILKITDATDKVIDQFSQPQGKQAIKPDAAYILDNMASDPNASYLPGSCTDTTCTTLARGGYKFQRDNGWNFAVKTGTTNNGFDGLMTSWSSQFAVVSWVGNHKRNVDISLGGHVAMETLTEPLTRGMMEAAHANLKPTNWTAPPGIKTAPAFVVRNHIHYGDIEPSPSNDLYPSWYVQSAAAKNSGATTIDKVSGKTATSCTPDAAKQTSSNSNDNIFSVDIFVTGAATNAASGTDDVHNCSDIKPSITLTVTDSTTQQVDVCTSSCTITATVTAGTHPLTDPQYAGNPGTVNFSVNGQVIKSFTITDSPSTVSFTYVPTASGTQTISAQVIDSVLYDATDSSTVTATLPATGNSNNSGNGNNPSNNQGQGNSGH